VDGKKYVEAWHIKTSYEFRIHSQEKLSYVSIRDEKARCYDFDPEKKITTLIGT